MKKQYTAPEIMIIDIDSSDIICASAGFGSGETEDMHAKDFNFDDENLLFFE
ncbi:MAG: hypothetical protein MJZ36_09810 [Bacteroidaceae bacterium]|nr:hypothetical protein [Bacteroidaceae bacterium]